MSRVRWWMALLVAVGCGGKTEDVGPGPGSGGQGGAGGSGGTWAGGSGAVATGGTSAGSAGSSAAAGGTFGGSAGSGGTSAGTGGAAGSGGIGGTQPTCPPVADCNWCNGTTVFDPAGCEIGYRCANGADPCTTKPCTDTAGCDPGALCDLNGLCWQPKPQCDESCAGPGGQSCTCQKKCSDGSLYDYACTMDSSYHVTCRCKVDAAPSYDCGMGGGAGSACEFASKCCGFPQ